MAYTPVNWQTGDTITAERLNRMDRGWDVETTELFNETVTTADDGDGNYARLAYVGNIDAYTITVTFDGTKYVCQRIDADGEYFYGDFDFTTHPFSIIATSGKGSMPAINEVYTETAGEHTISAAMSVIESGIDFSAAVNLVADIPIFPLAIGTTTWRQVVGAMAAGKLVLRVGGSTYDGDTSPNTQWASTELVADAYIDAHGDYRVSAIKVLKGVQSIASYSATTADGALN